MPNARTQLSGTSVFYDDFSDGVWTKFPGNPVMARSQPWAESDYICEPNIVFDGNMFHNWFSQMFPVGGRRTALGYATSPDGFSWTKYQKNPVLVMENGEVHRPYVMGHDGKYYCFGVQNEYQAEGPSTMHRWASTDGINWGDERLVMTADQPWEVGLSNMSVIVDDDGSWRMLYTGTENQQKPLPGFGYAWSRDGISWTKYKDNPVITGFYGGDPFLVKIGDAYYTWHCQSMGGSLRICCRRSKDMIDWHPVCNYPQISYTQPWEQGVPEEQGGTTVAYYGHLTDATLCEAHGKVFLVYQGAQTPLGVATFDGTFAELARALRRPPLSKWKESPFGMVDGKTLKIGDNGSDRKPLVAQVEGVRDRYIMECRIQRYGGATHRISVIMRYGDENMFARFWLHDNEHTFYQECIRGLFSQPVNIGPNHACDDAWHDWTVEVDGAANRLRIDGRAVGEGKTSSWMLRALADMEGHIGFSALDAFVSIDYVEVKRMK